MCDLVHQYSYLLSKSFLHLTTALTPHVPGPNTLGYSNLFH